MDTIVDILRMCMEYGDFALVIGCCVFVLWTGVNVSKSLLSNLDNVCISRTPLTKAITWSILLIAPVESWVMLFSLVGLTMTNCVVRQKNNNIQSGILLNAAEGTSIPRSNCVIVAVVGLCCPKCLFARVVMILGHGIDVACLIWDCGTDWKLSGLRHLGLLMPLILGGK